MLNYLQNVDSTDLSAIGISFWGAIIFSFLLLYLSNKDKKN